MKRARDDGVPGPLAKRPAGSVNKAETPPPSNAQLDASGQRLTTDDALAYLKAVKEKFKDDKEKYDEFLEVMKDFKAARIDTTGVIARVKDLFRGHRALILGFNTFLPKGYEITMPLEEEAPQKKQPVEFDQAINYVNKIKTRFQSDESVYKAFLEILNMYRKGNKTIIEVYQEVATLFIDHADLLEEFTYFLPDTSGITAGNSAQQPAGAFRMAERMKPSSRFVHTLPVKDEKLAMPARRMPTKSVLVAPKREKSGPILDQKPSASELAGAHKASDRNEKGGDGDKGDKDEKERIKEEKRGRDREREREKKDIEREKEREALAHRREERRTSARMADEAIRRQSNQGDAGGAGPSGGDGRRWAKATINLPKEMAFFEKVKARLRNKDLYQEFLKCLNIFSQEIISRNELLNLVKGLFNKKYPDLMDSFHDFLSRCENLEVPLAQASKKYDLSDVKPKIEQDNNRDTPARVEGSGRAGREAREDRRNQSEGGHGGMHAAKESQRAAIVNTKEKYLNKPISELDLSNCDRCTPSYRLLPRNYPRPISSHRTELGMKVLNDHWVSVTSGSEDYSFKHMRKNQYEESLFRCEDDRFELDMLLESTSVTAKKVAELVEKMQDMNAEQTATIRVDEHLSAISMRCIERIYGDHGLDIMELLRKNSAVALPVILARLRQKQDEWHKCRQDMNKVWAEVYAKNYHKSLDHRSFYFKQQDKKNLSIKGLLAEIKETNEKKRQLEENVLAVAAGNRRLLVPDMAFQYSDPDIHEDLYQIVKFSAEEVCNTNDQSERIMRFWTNFIEPLFGVPPRPHGAEDTLETAATFSKGLRTRGGLSVIEPITTEAGSSGNESAGSGENGGGSPHATGGGGGGAEDTNKGSFEGTGGGGGGPDTNGVSPRAEAAGDQEEEPVAAAEDAEDEEDEDEEEEEEGNEAGQAGSSVAEKGAGGEGENDDVAPNTASAEEDDDVAMEDAAQEEHQGADGAAAKAASVEAAEAEPEAMAEVGGGASAVPGDEIVACVGSGGAEGDAMVVAQGEGAAEEGGAVAALAAGVAEEIEIELSPSPPLDGEEDTHGGRRTSGTVSSAMPNGVLENGVRRYGRRGNQEEEDEAEAEHEAEDADDEGEEEGEKSSEESEENASADEEEGSEDHDEQDEREEEHDDEDEDEEHEGKGAESEGEAEGGADADDADGDGAASAASPDRSFALCKPVAAHPPSVLVALGGAAGGSEEGGPLEDNSNVFYGNDTFYVLFRLHQALYERIESAKTNARAAEQKWKNSKDGNPPDLYAKFFQVLFNLLDGTIENSKFEDECRAIIGTHSYILFTIDKLIFKFVKQLQATMTDDMANKLLGLHAYEKSRALHGFVDPVYQSNACILLHDDNVYRIENKKSEASSGAGGSELTVQLMDTPPLKLDASPGALEASFGSYLHEFLQSVPDAKDPRLIKVFLSRNVRKCKAESEADALLRVLDGVHVFNGLECKISCESSKVSYVLDTEDIFHRRKVFVDKNRSVKRGNKISDNLKAFGEFMEKHIAANA